jgi:hypothetical protein
LEVVVHATPEQCMGALWDYFRQEWPYRGEVYRGENCVSFVEHRGPLSSMLGDATSVEVSMEPVGRQSARLCVAAHRRKHAEILQKWLRDELPRRIGGYEERLVHPPSGSTWGL